MSIIIRSALLALVLTSASAAMAASSHTSTDQSQLCGSHSPNSQMFWECQTRHGGGGGNSTGPR